MVSGHHPPRRTRQPQLSQGFAAFIVSHRHSMTAAATRAPRPSPKLTVPLFIIHHQSLASLTLPSCDSRKKTLTSLSHLPAKETRRRRPPPPIASGARAPPLSSRKRARERSRVTPALCHQRGADVPVIITILIEGSKLVRACVRACDRSRPDASGISILSVIHWLRKSTLSDTHVYQGEERNSYIFRQLIKAD